MKVKTSELEGAALDWAVAAALDVQSGEARINKACRVEATTPAWIERENEQGSAPHYHRFSPSTNWYQGGPIIEREQLCIGYKHQADPDYCTMLESSTLCWARTTAGGHLSYGPTPLIAAMRCFCAAKLGDYIDIPENLNYAN